MKYGRALVVGGGFAGLVMARVLADHFTSVVIVERDANAGYLAPRPGVAQGAHLHVLLKRGQDILRQLFPGIEQIFESASCPRVDWSEDTRWDSARGTFPSYPSHIKTYSLSRPFLEGTIHALVGKRANVSFHRAHATQVKQAQGLATHLETTDANFDGAADLVVLCGGQNFPCNRISGHEIDLPREHLPVQITYRSVVYSTTSLRLNPFKQYYYQISPPHERVGAVIAPVENGRTVATIVEYGPPHALKTDLDGFMKLAARVPGGELQRILRHGFPLSEVAVFHKTDMYMRRPDKIAAFPRNLLCAGDVFCTLNPVFGQGMTAALIQAELLNHALTQGTLNARSFHRQSAARLHLPFLLSRIGSGSQPGFASRYLGAYLARCQHSVPLHRKFLGALHLQNSYPAIFDFAALRMALFTRAVHD